MAVGDERTFEVEGNRYRVRVVPMPGRRPDAPPPPEPFDYERVAIQRLGAPEEPEVLTIMRAGTLSQITPSEFAKILRRAERLARIPSATLATVLYRAAEQFVTTLGEWRGIVAFGDVSEDRRTEPEAAFTADEAAELAERLQAMREDLKWGRVGDLAPSEEVVAFIRRGAFKVSVIG